MIAYGHVHCAQHNRTMLNTRSPKPESKDRINTPWCQCCGETFCRCTFTQEKPPKYMFEFTVVL